MRSGLEREPYKITYWDWEEKRLIQLEKEKAQSKIKKENRSMKT